MKTKGICKLPCYKKGKTSWIEFIIIETRQQPILGAQTCLEEGLIIVPGASSSTQEINVIDDKETDGLTMQEIDQEYADVF